MQTQITSGYGAKKIYTQLDYKDAKERAKRKITSKEHQGMVQTRSTTRIAEETRRKFAWAQTGLWPNDYYYDDDDDDDDGRGFVRAVLIVNHVQEYEMKTLSKVVTFEK